MEELRLTPDCCNVIPFSVVAQAKQAACEEKMYKSVKYLTCDQILLTKYQYQEVLVMNVQVSKRMVVLTFGICTPHEGECDGYYTGLIMIEVLEDSDSIEEDYITTYFDEGSMLDPDIEEALAQGLVPRKDFYLQWFKQLRDLYFDESADLLAQVALIDSQVKTQLGE